MSPEKNGFQAVVATHRLECLFYQYIVDLTVAKGDTSRQYFDSILTVFALLFRDSFFFVILFSQFMAFFRVLKIKPLSIIKDSILFCF